MWRLVGYEGSNDNEDIWHKFGWGHSCSSVSWNEDRELCPENTISLPTISILLFLSHSVSRSLALSQKVWVVILTKWFKGQVSIFQVFFTYMPHGCWKRSLVHKEALLSQSNQSKNVLSPKRKYILVGANEDYFNAQPAHVYTELRSNPSLFHWSYVGRDHL